MTKEGAGPQVAQAELDRFRVYPMLGFKRFGNASVTIRGIELIDKIRKEQFATSELRLKESRAQELWQALLAA